METKTYKPIGEYKSGDKVEVLINNPRNNNQEEWRNGEVIDKRMIIPRDSYIGLGRCENPYPILIVRLIRTYCKATPTYKWIDGNIPVYVDSVLEYYDKENDEGFLYAYTIRPKEL